jgi:DNA-binding CsgD family transcriptional regulator
VLVGRQHERGVIERALAAARTGAGGAILITGEAGIGKSALLDHAAASAAVFTVARATAREGDRLLPAETLRTLLEQLGAEEEMDVVRGPEALGVAALDAIARASESGPLLLVVDDAHDLDPPSRIALLFAIARLEHDPVLALFAARAGEAGTEALQYLQTLRLTGLGETESRELLALDPTRPVDQMVAARLVREAAGNPLALLELQAALTDEQRLGRTPLGEPVRLTSDLEHLFSRRVAALTERERKALLFAAAEGTGTLEALVRALESRGLALGDLEAAERADLVTIGPGSYEFRHPLVRSAVYHAASAPDVRDAHTALAAVADRDRRAYHLARAVVRPDEAVAAELEEAARTSAARGAPEVAADLFDAAAGLSTSSSAAAERLAEAARSANLAAQPRRAHELADRALVATDDPLTRADAEEQRALALLLAGQPREAADAIVSASTAVEAHDRRRAATLTQSAVLPLVTAGRYDFAVSVAQRADELAAGGDGRLEREIGELLLAVQLMTTDAGPHEQARARFESLRSESPAPSPHLIAYVWLEDYETADTVLRAAAAAAREAGQISAFAFALAHRAENAWWTGRFTEGYALAAESLQLARATGAAFLIPYAAVLIARFAAAAGREEEARASIAEADAYDARGIESMRFFTLSARGFLELGLGHAEVAAGHLEELGRYSDERRLHLPTIVPWHADLVEAELQARRPERAREALERLRELAERTGSRWATGAALRYGALVDEADAEESFARALDLHSATPFERGRTLLSYAEWLATAGRESEARSHAAQAALAFERLGALPWLERARRVGGGDGARRTVPLEETLSPKELQVALAVAEGATNQEAAAALFVSPKTIEFHLGNAYRKLGIRSRVELAALVARAEAA